MGRAGTSPSGTGTQSFDNTTSSPLPYANSSRVRVNRSISCMGKIKCNFLSHWGPSNFKEGSYHLEVTPNNQMMSNMSAMMPSQPLVPWMQFGLFGGNRTLSSQSISDQMFNLGAKKSTKKGSNDTEEMINVLSSMEAANILSRRGVAASVSPADVLPAVGVLTVSGSFPTVSAIFTTASVVTPYTRRSRGIRIIGTKDKGKEKVIETEVPKKRKLQEQIDARVAREMEEEFARENQRLSLHTSNEVIAKRLSKYEQAKANLSVREKIDLINWKLYDTYDVHHVSTKDQDIFMLVEKDYPLRKGLATVMICNKLQVFKFTDRYRGSYSTPLGSAVCPFYCSYLGFNDELLWAAAWIHRASRAPSYLNYLKNKGAEDGLNDDDFSFSWDDKRAGTKVLISKLFLTHKNGDFEFYKEHSDRYICSLIPVSPSELLEWKLANDEQNHR
uniref:cellulase n=1 Tax=Tanacetum cinerariifolium TaxID=118510 RepID=A0A6L2KLY4_TANCI|nr:endo-1,4-D-glucanase [Tanacetum cinerariifolium]